MENFFALLNGDGNDARADRESDPSVVKDSTTVPLTEKEKVRKLEEL